MTRHCEFDFTGSVVVVIGGTGDIGGEVARGFLGAGATVYVAGRSADPSRNEPAAPDRWIEVPLDVRSVAEVDQFFGSLDRLDVLVNCQGASYPDAEYEEDAFSAAVDLNLVSVMRCARAARSLLGASGGSILNLASVLSFLAAPEVPAYSASKTGLVGLTRSLAHQFGPEGIRVNAVAPGFHRTKMTIAAWSDPSRHREIASRAALGRWGECEDLVAPCMFLATDQAAFITGAVLPVDGGFHSGLR